MEGHKEDITRGKESIVYMALVYNSKTVIKIQKTRFRNPTWSLRFKITSLSNGFVHFDSEFTSDERVSEYEYSGLHDPDR